MPSLAGFIGPTYSALSPIADCEVAMCLYPEMIDGGGTGKNKVVYYRTPGRKLATTLPTSPLRCLLYGDYRLFAVAGDTVYEVFQDGTYTALVGTVIDDGRPAQIIPNGNQLWITSGQQGYLCNDGVNVVPWRFWDADAGTPSGDLIKAEMSAYLDGYYIAAISQSQQFNVSSNASQYGGYQWNPLEYGLKQSNPDRVAAIIEAHGELRVFGTKTGETWTDTAAPPPGIPLTKNLSGSIEQGISAPWSLAKLDDESLMWIGGDDRGQGVVYRATGYAPMRASNHAMEAAMQQYARTDDAVAYTYQENGHSFYSVTFPTAQATWCFDAVTGLWHQRGYWSIPQAKYVSDLAMYHTFAFGVHLVGGGDGTGKIYQQSITIPSDDGNPIRWWRRAPHVNTEAKMLRHGTLQLDMQVGSADQGTDPQVTLRTSNNGGRTWGNERTVSSGAIGQYRKRVEWRQLGRARDRVYEVYGSDPVPTLCLVDAYLDVQPGNGT